MAKQEKDDRARSTGRFARPRPYRRDRIFGQIGATFANASRCILSEYSRLDAALDLLDTGHQPRSGCLGAGSRCEHVATGAAHSTASLFDALSRRTASQSKSPLMTKPSTAAKPKPISSVVSEL